jgi:hypothetical protein
MTTLQDYSNPSNFCLDRDAIFSLVAENEDTAVAFWGDEHCVAALAVSNLDVEPDQDLDLNIDLFVPDESGEPILLSSSGSSWLSSSVDSRHLVPSNQVWWSGFMTSYVLHDGRRYEFGSGVAGRDIDIIRFHGTNLDGYVVPSEVGAFILGGCSEAVIFAGPEDVDAPFGIDRQHWLDFGGHRG